MTEKEFETLQTQEILMPTPKDSTPAMFNFAKK